jgi:DNA-binding transcriptional LysR family regulator
MNLHHLRVFEAVAREGSLGEAAHALGCTQPTVSHHLAALEKDLGTTLFVRGRRGVEPTDRGRVLLAHVDLILRQVDTAQRAVRDLVELREGVLRVATFATAGATFLPPLIVSFREAHPGIRVLLQECQIPADAVEDVRTRRVDLAVVNTTPDHWLRPVPGLAIAKLFSDPLHVVVPATHPFADQQTIALSDLAGESWITGRNEDDPCNVLLHRAAQAVGFEPEIAVRVDDFATMGGCVSAGLGVALVPQLAVPRLPKDVKVAELAGGSLARDVSAIVSGDGSSLPAAAFMKELRHVDSVVVALRS